MEKKLKEYWMKVKKFAAKTWDKATDVLAKVLVWCLQNWQVTLALLGALGGLLKQVSKLKKARDEEEYRNRRFYDRRTDRWCYANKHLSKKQQNIIEERYLDGESYRSILDSMDLLK